MKAVRVHQHGGPEALRYENVDIPVPGAGEVLVRHAAIGLNFLDVYYRSGLYPAPNGLPLTPGGEAAGVIEAVGAGVTELREGDRVAYTTPLGAYAEKRVISADRVVRVPDGVSDEQAAACSSANGRSTSAPPSSARRVHRTRSNWLWRTASTTSSTTASRISSPR